MAPCKHNLNPSSTARVTIPNQTARQDGGKDSMVLVGGAYAEMNEDAWFYLEMRLLPYR